MKCAVCGGKIKYKDGLYVCENCKSVQTIDSYFENIEVFIAYVENDELGRRTKDSIIAQEIYNKLSNANINTFFQRVSTSEITSEDFKKAYFKAITQAKIIITLACNKENFDKILSENEEYIIDKRIIPVYKDIDAYDIPSNISELQAINYDNIGAIADLENSVLRFLGKEKEINVVSLAEQNRKRKRNLIIANLGSFLVIMVAIALFYIFGTNNVLSSKKYEYANELVLSGQFINAMETYTEIYEYQDSAEQLKKIYSKYNGYYENNNDKYHLQLQIIENMSIEISCDYDDASFDITVPLNLNVAKFEFVDSKNNSGSGSLLLNDDGIELSLTISNNDEIIEIYSFNDRTDQKTIRYDKELLLSWLSKDMTVDKLKSNGYKFKFVNYIHAELGSIYSLEDTSIGLFVGYGNDVVALSAPASILCPEKIGQSAKPYLKGNYLYAPFGTFPNSSLFTITSYDDVENKTIEKDTTVYMTKRGLVGEDSWEIMMEEVEN